MVAGPNGAGKSTLIHALAGTIPYEGDIRFLGKPQKSLTPRNQAKIVGVLSQHHSVNIPLLWKRWYAWADTAIHQNFHLVQMIRMIERL